MTWADFLHIIELAFGLGMAWAWVRYRLDRMETRQIDIRERLKKNHAKLKKLRRTVYALPCRTCWPPEPKNNGNNDES